MVLVQVTTMNDLQVLEIRDILNVTNVLPAHGITPRTVRIFGSDFNSAHEILINDAKSPSVIIISSRELLAQVPPSIGGAAVRSVAVISHRLTNTRSSKLTYKLGDTTRTISGMERLIQQFIKMLLSTPGRDIFAKKIGGGLLRTVARQTARGGGSMVADLHMGVDRTRRQIMTLQANDKTVALTERLLYARVVEARFIQQELALVGKIAMGNQANQQSVTALRL
jgi:hypothetical protein